MAAAKPKAAKYDVECPVCKTTKYRNPLMKLKVNTCGHALCENCVNVIFTKESGQCPECNEVLKKSKFRMQIFDDPVVEKEIDIRRKMMRIYNRLEEDFATTEEHDNYLEELETIVYSLTFDVDRAEAEARVDAYERANKEAIKRNQGRRGEANELLERYLEREKEQQESRLQEDRLEKEKTKKSKNTQDTLMRDLMSHDGDASIIVKTFKEKLRAEEAEAAPPPPVPTPGLTEFSSGVRIGLSAGLTTAPAPLVVHEAVPYTYTEPVMPAHLPLPTWDALPALGYLRHVRAVSVGGRAGGYTEQYAAMRALQELMAGHMLAPVS